MPTDPCVFCEIIAGRAKAAIVHEWDHAIALIPLKPVTEGHLLVIPKIHVRDFTEDPGDLGRGDALRIHPGDAAGQHHHLGGSRGYPSRCSTCTCTSCRAARTTGWRCRGTRADRRGPFMPADPLVHCQTRLRGEWIMTVAELAKIASRMRIAILGEQLVKAVGRVRDQHPDLTWEETLAALNDAAGRAIGHLLNDEDVDHD